jgi:hypothetical protein
MIDGLKLRKRPTVNSSTDGNPEDGVTPFPALEAGGRKVAEFGCFS